MNSMIEKRAWRAVIRLLVLTATVSLASAPLAPALRVPVQDSQGKADTPAPPEKIGGDVKAPVLLEAPDPVYPKGQTKSGVCVVGMVVNTDGVPQEVHVLQPLGADFDSSAVAAVKQYRFKPATKAGKPVAVEVRVEVQFRKY